MTREREMRIWLVALVVAALLLYMLSSVLMPFVAGLAIAYFLHPIADKMEKPLRSRAGASALILLVFTVIIAGIGVSIFPLLQAQVIGLLALVPDAVETARNAIEPYIIRLETELDANDLAKLKDAAGGYVGEIVSWTVGVLKNIFMGGRAFVSALSLLLIAPIVSFFLLRDWNSIVAKFNDLLPRESAETIREQLNEMDTTIAGFVRGQALVCVTLGTIYGTGLTLVGLDFGLLIGIGTGLMAFVPYVGMAIGSLVALGVALMQFSELTDFLLVALVFGVGQSIDAAFLTPTLVGGRVGLHPVWIIFALMTGGALFGFTGVLLAVPTAAMIGVLVRFSIGRYRNSELYLGHGPNL